ncbi:MAG: hypothetical protein Q4G14_04085 [Paracoccus sp. (in: a-proteobacteria)]|uniref:hypothetical protein n=1 Tax=Paracoccus sp. TaxID=267 RepID=UPI0026E0474C|nr:hypothetical protein [Paracoccus sp. (in: a-proteobacteria)]MDO5612408.1 hypothetical protein [Paracoccus sp. (in: a-proteobacteria)]
MRKMMRRALRLIALWAMLLPLMLSSLVPAAIMPMRDAGGTVTMVICTAEGMVEAAFDPVTMQPLPDSGDDRREGPQSAPCPCAGTHPPATLDPLGAIIRPAGLALRRDACPQRQAAPRLAAVTGLPPATGPPSAS